MTVDADDVRERRLRKIADTARAEHHQVAARHGRENLVHYSTFSGFKLARQAPAGGRAPDDLAARASSIAGGPAHDQ